MPKNTDQTRVRATAAGTRGPRVVDENQIQHPVAAALGLIAAGALVSAVLGGLAKGLSGLKQ